MIHSLRVSTTCTELEEVTINRLVSTMTENSGKELHFCIIYNSHR